MSRCKNMSKDGYVNHSDVVFTKNSAIPPNRIRIIRMASNLNIKTLAQELGISPSMLQQIETQKKSLSIEILIKTSELFGISTDYILYQSEKPDRMFYNSITTTNINQLKDFLHKEEV